MLLNAAAVLRTVLHQPQFQVLLHFMGVQRGCASGVAGPNGGREAGGGGALELSRLLSVQVLMSYSKSDPKFPKAIRD
jgi:hypothetical protein